jgi:hypothetical protein
MKWIGHASAPSGNFEVPSAEPHNAVCIALIELGRHVREFEQRDKSKVKKLTPFIAIIFELAQLKNGSSERHVIAERFSFTFGLKSNLRKLLEGWRGEAYPPEAQIPVANILGQPCQVNITHAMSRAGNPIAKLGGVSKLMAGVRPLQPQHLPFVFDFTDDTGNLLPARRQKPFPDDLAAWVPWIYGETVEQVLKQSYEWHKGTGLPLPPDMAEAEATALRGGGGEPAEPDGDPAGGQDVPF